MELGHIGHRDFHSRIQRVDHRSLDQSLDRIQRGLELERQHLGLGNLLGVHQERQGEAHGFRGILGDIPQVSQRGEVAQLLLGQKVGPCFLLSLGLGGGIPFNLASPGNLGFPGFCRSQSALHQCRQGFSGLGVADVDRIPKVHILAVSPVLGQLVGIEPDQGIA